MVGAVTATCLGIALIAIVAHDVFDALFHHRGAGILSGAVMRATWWGFRRASVRRRRLLPLAGPCALVAIVTLWLVLLVTGWALVLWPHMGDAFRFDPGAASGEGAFVDALYVSLVTLATLGFGDITPASGWLKVLLPLEALIGLGLLTATVSWLLSIHPALSRRRSLAYEISLLRRAEADLHVFALDDAVSDGALSELTSRLVAVERDLTAWPIAYYFAEADERFSLPVAMPYLLGLAARGTAPDLAPGVRLRAAMLSDAIDDFAATTAARSRSVGGGDTVAILRSYAGDHLVEIADRDDPDAGAVDDGAAASRWGARS
jgi:hypothetical protein